jgi:uncharacterized membrane protein
MGALIFQGVAILIIVVFLAYLAYDDRRNTREREEEDRLQAEKEARQKE